MTFSRSLAAAVAVLVTSVLVTSILVTSILTGPVSAQEFVPAVVFDMGGKFDKSFNEAAYAGAERFKKETNIAYRDFEVTAEAQREQALRNMALPACSISALRSSPSRSWSACAHATPIEPFTT